MLKAFALVLTAFTSNGEEMRDTLNTYDSFEECESEAWDMEEISALAGAEQLSFVCEDTRTWVEE